MRIRQWKANATASKETDESMMTPPFIFKHSLRSRCSTSLMRGTSSSTSCTVARLKPGYHTHNPPPHRHLYRPVWMSLRIWLLTPTTLPLCTDSIRCNMGRNIGDEPRGGPRFPGYDGCFRLGIHFCSLTEGNSFWPRWDTGHGLSSSEYSLLALRGSGMRKYMVSLVET